MVCAYNKCSKTSIFNYPTEIKGIFCNEHKKEGMIDVKNKKCQYENCNKRPTFNFITEKQGILCDEHKKDGMISVANKNKLCQYKNCTTRATFNFATEKKPNIVLIIKIIPWLMYWIKSANTKIAQQDQIIIMLPKKPQYFVLNTKRKIWFY